MKINDAQTPQDSIEAGLDGELVEIIVHGYYAECVYITKDDARKLGERLIELAAQLISSAPS